MFAVSEQTKHQPWQFNLNIMSNKIDNVNTLKNAALSTSVGSGDEVDIPVGRPLEGAVTHEVCEADLLDDSARGVVRARHLGAAAAIGRTRGQRPLAS